MKSLVIRNDDVLQVHPVSKQQRKVLKEKGWFERFLEADKVFAEYDYLSILAVLSDGIDVYPNWVDYIKRNIHRFKIELHGSGHLKYVRMNEEKGYNDLKKAKEKIEETFDVKVTTWYVPFGRKNIPEWGHRVCERLGIKMDVPTMKSLPYFWKKKPERKQINFHYWDDKQVKQINKIIKEICQK